LPALAAFTRPKAFMQKYLEVLPRQLQRFENVSDNNVSMMQQAMNLTALLHFFFMEYGIPMVAAPQFAQSLIKWMFKNESDPVNEQLVSLGISLPGNKTAEMGELMYKLAGFDAIKSHTSAEAFITELKQRNLDPVFLQAWDEFMKEFGARCPSEIDVATPRPNEQPTLLFQLLKNMSLSTYNSKGSKTIFTEARAKREAAYHVLYELALQKGKLKAKSLEKYYSIWITLGGYRETPKHYVIKVIDLFRKSVLQIAETFVSGNRLDLVDQIFDLTINDIDHAISNASLDLRILAKERTELTNKIRKSHLVARIIDSRGKIFYPPRKDAKEGELIGVSISPGIVKGKVKVLHSADEKKLLPGEILVTRATDPGWTPLFINAGGIILEIGSALQHGAVVAREYGIPCVSGLDGATDILKDGQMVEVDGSNGVVRVIDGG
jgi:phosphohistidine swiveling domain-containing protein